jgi:type II secretory pathway pseudopilin PulG
MSVKNDNRRLLPVLRRESGFAIVEVLVAAIIFVIGSLATFQILDAATRNKLRTEQRQVGLDRAQREIEKLRDVGYGKLAMTATPASQPSQSDPRWRVHGTDFALNKDGTGDATMVVKGTALYGGGQVASGVDDSLLVNPGPEHFVSGDISGDIFRFVVWRDDPNCQTVCPGSQDLKRVIVAVKIDSRAQTGQRAYMETQSDFINPADSSLTSLPPTPSGTVTAQQLYLSDTPCAAVGATSRVVPSADHLVHNTLGSCASGPHTGIVAGAPDALLTSPPPGTTDDPSFDYASDIEPTSGPNTDKGLQLVRQEVSGCAYSPAGENPQAKIHRWITDPMPTGGFTLTGNATLEIYSQTVNDAQMEGKICVYLFVRNVLVDTWVVDFGTGSPYFTYSRAAGVNWWSGDWGKVRRNMQFSPVTVPAGQRLGVAISLERSVSATDGFQFIYDHPAYQARLEVDTTTPLGG